MNPAPVALFVYNRPVHTKKTVEALLANTEAKDTDLYIFADAAKNGSVCMAVSEVRNYVRSIAGFRSVNIMERDVNFGLAKSIIEGVTHVINKYGRIIVLEDDIVTSPFFLRYMNDALKCYENDERVISISGYNYPIKQALPETFFLRGADCWSWATWARGWDLFEPDAQHLLDMLNERRIAKEFNYDGAYNFKRMLALHIRGKIDSWAVRWYASAFLNNKLTLYPGTSLVRNIGADGSGTHFGTTEIYSGASSEKPVNVYEIPVVESQIGRSAIVKYIRHENKAELIHRLINKIVRIIKKNV